MDLSERKRGLCYPFQLLGIKTPMAQPLVINNKTKQIIMVAPGSVWTCLWMPLIQIPSPRVSTCFRVTLEVVDQLFEHSR